MNEQSKHFSTIIKESGVDWAIMISKQLEDGDDLRKQNYFISSNPIPSFQEITFNIQKCKSKQQIKIIPHDSNYYLQPLSNSDIKSLNDKEVSNDLFLQLSEQNYNNNNNSCP